MKKRLLNLYNDHPPSTNKFFSLPMEKGELLFTFIIRILVSIPIRTIELILGVIRWRCYTVPILPFPRSSSPLLPVARGRLVPLEIIGVGLACHLLISAFTYLLQPLYLNPQQ
ncbi:unnamed protein product [Blepharisma stoltei]|uniref:Uncharacterized protein n=1 Tax=Blepharisma stoltei TaxID=1481888 RepID=A0AAU9IYZ8_9CILI|nr:unnamed protein product [Blepharisma stoltei]